MKTEEMKKRIIEYLDYCEDDRIELINDLMNLPSYPNKNEMLTFAKADLNTFDTAYPIDYFRRIEEVYPDVKNGSFIYDYTTQRHGELTNINNLIVDRIYKAIK